MPGSPLWSPGFCQFRHPKLWTASLFAFKNWISISVWWDTLFTDPIIGHRLYIASLAHIGSCQEGARAHQWQRGGVCCSPGRLAANFKRNQKQKPVSTNPGSTISHSLFFSSGFHVGLCNSHNARGRGRSRCCGC